MNLNDFIVYIKYLKNKKNAWLGKIANWIKSNIDGAIIPFSTEHELNYINEKKLGKEVKIPSMIDKIVKAGLKALDLIYYFTIGYDECKCWVIRQNTKAPQAVAVIHSDMEKGVHKYLRLCLCWGNEMWWFF